jgi:hypothetical protein
VSDTRLRVVQWATGNIGTRALREVIRHPDLDLGGVLVYDPAKVGADAGHLCGEPATGVLATDDRAAVIGLGADCVLYLRPTGWRVRVDGDAPMDVALPFPIPVEDLGARTPGYTAHRPVNAIPYVCAAAPGILETTDLPPITPAGPRRPVEGALN